METDIEIKKTMYNTKTMNINQHINGRQIPVRHPLWWIKYAGLVLFLLYILSRSI